MRDLVVPRKERPATASKKKKGPNFKRFRKNAVRVAPASDIVTGDYLDKLAAAESETELQLTTGRGGAGAGEGSGGGGLGRRRGAEAEAQARGAEAALMGSVTVAMACGGRGAVYRGA